MSFATFTDYMSTGGSFTAAAGDRFNIKGAITSRTSTTDTWVNGGTSTSPVIIRGYNSVIGDLTTLARTSGNGPLVTTNYPTLTYTTGGISVTGSFIIIEALSVTTARSAGSIAFSSGTDNVVVSCAIANSSTNAGAISITLGTRSILFNCDLNLTGASGGTAAVSSLSAGAIVDSCRIKVVSTCPGILISTSGTAFGNTIYGSGGIGISMNSTAGAPYIRNNTIAGCSGDGINIITGTTVLQRIIGNMITDNTGNGINMVSAANSAFIGFNRLRDNSASINSGTDWATATSYGQASTDTGTTGTTATDYTNYAGNDFSLISASPATNANIPAYSSIGALQRNQISSAGTGTGFFIQ
jgi:hypothetical protein